MKHKSGKVLSLLLVLCMTLSMLTGLTLPAKAAATDLLIAMVYGGNVDEKGAAATKVGATASFIEIYNPTDRTISLDGYYLYYQGLDPQYAAARPANWAKLQLSPTAAVPAKHSYLIVCNAASYDSTKPYTTVPAGDQTWNIDVCTKGVKFLLRYGYSDDIENTVVNPFNTDGNGTKISGYVDMFGGAGNDSGSAIDGCETSYPAGSSYGSSKQKGFGRIDRNDDTDNNANDFQVIAFNTASPADGPRNLASGVYTADIVTACTIENTSKDNIVIALNKVCGDLTLDKITVTKNGGSISPLNLYKIDSKNYILTLPEAAVNGDVYTLSIASFEGYTFSGTTVTNNVAADTSVTLTSEMISAIPDQTFTGAPVTPYITVTCNSANLVKDKDYSVAYANNTMVGATATVIVTGLGDYSGTAIKNFSIVSSLPSTYGTKLTSLGSYSVGKQNGDGGVAEIVKYNKDNKKMYVVSGELQALDIVPLAQITAGQTNTYAYQRRIDIGAMGTAKGFSAGDITSVDVNTRLKVVAISVQHIDYDKQGYIVFLDYDGNYIKHFTAGIQPDMIGFSPDQNYVMTANEGEPRNGYDTAEGDIDPAGSVTIIDLSAVDTHDKLKALASDKISTVGFEAFDTQRAELLNYNVLLKTNTAPSVDLEPEYIAYSSDSTKAYVTLQEANAIGTFDMASKTFTSVKGLGFKDYNQAYNRLDLNNNGSVYIRNEDVQGVYMPDGLAAVTIGGIQYVITPNEGDAREWDEYEDIASKTINGSNKKVEYLLNSEFDGLNSNKTYILGARSFSIWNAADMSLVYDSGADFEVITAQAFAAIFNATHKNNDIEGRSNKKGPEPEDVKTLAIGSKTYAFIGLERIGGVMMYDISDPAAPVFVDYFNNRNPSVNSLTAGDLGAEGLCTIAAADSPTGYPMLLVANEVSGTVSVIQINEGYTASNKITLYHTNDLHGSVAGSATGTSQLAKIAELKNSTPNAILADAGDAIQGNSFAGLTKGEDVIALMNSAGYDVMGLGNHEFDYGLTRLTELAGKAKFPILGANAVKNSQPVLKDVKYNSEQSTNNGAYYIKEVSGVKVGFFGIVTPETATKANPDGIVGVSFGETVSDIVATSEAQIAALKQDGATIIVGIMHLGIDASSDITSEKVANAFTNPALKPDVIIDGHSHSTFNTTYNGIYVSQTGSGGSNVGKLVLNYDPSTKKLITSDPTNGIYSVNASTVAISALTSYDPLVESQAKTLLAAQSILLSPVVGTTSTTLWGGTVNGINEARAYETNLSDLVADSMLNAAKNAEVIKNNNTYKNYPIVALQNGGGVRTSIYTGSITKGDIISVLPFGNTLAYKLVTPDVLYKAIENGVGKITAQDVNTGKLTGLDGRFPQIAGMRIEVDLTKTATTYDGSSNPVTYGSRVTKIVLLNADGTDGQTLSRTDTTTQLILASNDFEIAGGDGYIMLKGLTSVGEGGVLDEVLADYIKTTLGGTVNYPITKGRIKFVNSSNGYQSKTYTATITLKKNQTDLWANTGVIYKIDGVKYSGTTNSSGVLTLSNLPDGPHTLTFNNTKDVLVNNYSGAGLTTAVTVTSTAPSFPEDTAQTPGGTTQSPTKTVQTVTTGGVSTATAEVKPTVSGKVAAATVEAAAIDTVIKAAVDEAKTKGTETRVEIRVEAAAGSTKVETTLEAKAFANIKSSVDTLQVSTSVADLSLDKKTLETISGASNGEIKISAGIAASSSLPASVQNEVGNRPVYEFSITSGGKAVTDFNGGMVNVTIPYTRKAEEDTSSIVIYYISDSGKLEVVKNAVYDSKTGTVSFMTGHFSKYAVGYVSVKFNDVSNQWYAEAVSFVASRELFGGVGNNSFAPEGTMTRAMFATVLARLDGADLTGYKASKFSDVDMAEWYGKSVAWAADKGIIGGYPNGKFGPNDSITREQMAVMLSRYIAYKGIKLPETGSTAAFTDSLSVSDYAKAAVAEMQKYGLISGMGDNSYKPLGTASRASVATIFMNLIKAMVK